jgi:hypothetical protein
MIISIRNEDRAFTDPRFAALMRKIRIHRAMSANTGVHRA